MGMKYVGRILRVLPKGIKNYFKTNEDLITFDDEPIRNSFGIFGIF